MDVSPAGGSPIVGMGKLGSHELTAGLDIDLILLYDYDDEVLESDGAKPLDPVRYFTRVTQRLIARLSAPTAEGILYDVDMRLRLREQGPVATRITAFAKYQRTEAWTWEHLALTRARCICGDESLVGEAEANLCEILTEKRPTSRRSARRRGDARPDRQGEAAEGHSGISNSIPGGLVDIEFIAQYLA